MCRCPKLSLFSLTAQVFFCSLDKCLSESKQGHKISRQDPQSEVCLLSLHSKPAVRWLLFHRCGEGWAERRGLSWLDRTKATGQSCLLYIDLELQTNSCLSLRNFFACLDWSFRDHSWLVTVHFAETLLKAVTASLVPEVFQTAHFKCILYLTPDSAH